MCTAYFCRIELPTDFMQQQWESYFFNMFSSVQFNLIKKAKRLKDLHRNLGGSTNSLLALLRIMTQTFLYSPCLFFYMLISLFLCFTYKSMNDYLSSCNPDEDKCKRMGGEVYFGISFFWFPKDPVRPLPGVLNSLIDTLWLLHSL